MTTPADFEIVTNFRDFDPHPTILVRKVQQRPKMECGGPKFCDISKSTGVVTKPFWGRTNIGLMFLFPWFDYGIDILNFEKSRFLVNCKETQTIFLSILLKYAKPICTFFFFHICKVTQTAFLSKLAKKNYFCYLANTPKKEKRVFAF